MMTKIACVVALGLSVVACSNAGPAASTVSSSGQATAPSGITASNGGGARAVGSIPNVGVTNGQAVVGGVPNRTGNAY